MSTLIKLSCSFAVCCMWFIFANYPREQETIHNKTTEMTQKWKNHCHYLCIEKCFRECFCFLNIGHLLPFFLHFYLWFCAHIHKHTSSHAHVHTPHLSLFSFAYLLSLPFPRTKRKKKIAASILQASLYHCHQHESPEYFHCAEEKRELWFFRAHRQCVSKYTAHLLAQTLLLRKALRCTLVFKAVTVPSLVHLGTLLGGKD